MGKNKRRHFRRKKQKSKQKNVYKPHVSIEDLRKIIKKEYIQYE